MVKLGKIEFGLIKTCNWEETKRQRALLKIGQGERIWDIRTLVWFWKQIFNRQSWGMYSGACRCFFIDIGPFYITKLSNECYHAKDKRSYQEIPRM
jgi:hypothetical protein